MKGPQRSVPRTVPGPRAAEAARPFLSDVVELRRRARRAIEYGAVTPAYGADREAVVRTIEREVSLASLVKASEEDLEWLYPGRGIEDSLAAWTKSGPRFCVATLGERGALAVLGKERIEVHAPRVEVVDTVGAGDSFMSALLSAMDRDRALGAGAPAPSRSELERWLRFAATASAITCTRKGADPPTRAEVEAALAA